MIVRVWLDTDKSVPTLFIEGTRRELLLLVAELYTKPEEIAERLARRVVDTLANE